MFLIRQKPQGMSSVVEYLNCKPSEVVIIGDRYLTDITFGNLHGSLTIYTDPITNEGENFIVRWVRCPLAL